MTTNKNGRIAEILAYLSVCIIWGSTYLAMRIAVKESPPEIFAGMRFSIAGAAILIFARIKGYEFPHSFKDACKTSVVGLFLLFGANGMVMWAEQWVHSGITAVVLSTTPLFTAILEFFLIKESRLNLFGWICLIAGFAGVALLVVSGNGVGSIDIAGSLLVLLASFSWSCGTVYSKKVKTSGSIFPQIGIQMLAAGLGLSILGTIMGELPRVRFTTNVVLPLIYLIVFGSIIGYGSNMFLLKRWPASRVITSAYINPMVAVILGVLILDEGINLKMVFSMGIILAAVILLQVSRNKTVKSHQVPNAGEEAVLLEK
jgi:drug/metabolite transporter (DMT)-like permease